MLVEGLLATERAITFKTHYCMYRRAKMLLKGTPTSELAVAVIAPINWQMYQRVEVLLQGVQAPEFAVAVRTLITCVMN